MFLLFASLFFYAWGEPSFVLVMMASILLNWLLGFLIGKNPGKTGLRRAFLAVDVFLNLGLLFVFKYLAFASDLLNRFFGAGLRLPEIALPIGISFFTFQAISYVVDVYREKREALNNILYVGLYAESASE